MSVNMPSILAPPQGQHATVPAPLQHQIGVIPAHGEFLPTIPLLTGLTNVKAWKYAVHVYLNHYDLLDFIDGTHGLGRQNDDSDEDPDVWRRRRAQAYTIISGTICHKTVMPMLLSAGFEGYDAGDNFNNNNNNNPNDNYDLDPQTLWDFICRYVKVGSREGTCLMDRILLHMFNPAHLDADSRFDPDEYLYLRRYLREYYELEVHPEVMKRLGVDEMAIEHDDAIFLGDLPGAQAVGKWPVEGTVRRSVSRLFDAADLCRLEVERFGDEEAIEN
ncbi:hypothetical protein B0T20DRAFT_511512 [Sordaria brevicollis]|uniref:Uncharacterized protein n=1 Tax=Sordaria brevicollis TaxID=83679 RepID=A0AAE0NVG1_SORBR|nr:hypothetical protein B0T20DRAFT_511512 [Sordaria brevicollis]